MLLNCDIDSSTICIAELLAKMVFPLVLALLLNYAETSPPLEAELPMNVVLPRISTLLLVTARPLLHNPKPNTSENGVATYVYAAIGNSMDSYMAELPMKVMFPLMFTLLLV